MCLAVYLASDIKIPLKEYNSRIPKFYVSEIDKDDIAVRSQFKLPYVAYAGSNEGCGCGYFKEGLEGNDLELAKENYYSLAHCISSLKLKGGKVALFSCWEGDQSSVPEIKEKLPIQRLVSEEFEFKEKAYYEIV